MRHAFGIAFLFYTVTVFGNQQTDSLLRELDKFIRQQDNYVHEKVERIAMLKAELKYARAHTTFYLYF